MADAVLSGALDRSDGIAASQILNVWLRACETQRKVEEQDALLDRLEALEAKAGRLSNVSL